MGDVLLRLGHVTPDRLLEVHVAGDLLRRLQRPQRLVLERVGVLQVRDELLLNGLRHAQSSTRPAMRDA